MDAHTFESLLRDATRPTRTVVVPEIALSLAADLPTLWAACEASEGRAGCAAPYWGVAWPGGQALARHILDHPHLVRGRRVLDLGSGSGLCAIAAAMSGARDVFAADIDPVARLAIARNAALNAVVVTPVAGDLVGHDPAADVILAADLWYERFLARRVTGWLRDLARAGHDVLIADPGRAFAPREDLEELARIAFKPAPGLEPGETTSVRVCRLGPHPAPARACQPYA